MSEPGQPPRRSPLSCLGCGCAAGVAVILAVVVTLTWVGYRAGERFRSELADPAARWSRVEALIPFRDPPAGYHPLGGVSIPWLMEMAILVDRPPGSSGEGAVEAGFLFVRTRGGFGRRQRLEQLFAEEVPDPKAFSQGEVGFEAREDLGRGELAAGGATVHYYARRGVLTVDQSRFGVELAEGAEAAHRYPGIATMMLVDCPAGDDRLRVAIWFARDPQPDLTAATADLTGTPGDPAALTAFLDHFRLCA